MKPKAVLAFCREKGIKAFDLRFVDIHGGWRHITYPISSLNEASFEEGFGHQVLLNPSETGISSHAILIPQGDASYLDPFTKQPTLVILASVQDAIMREESPIHARHVAIQATRYLQSTGIGDSLAILTGCEFRTYPNQAQPAEHLDKNSFLACGPMDRDFNFRCESTDCAAEAGVHIDRHFSNSGFSSSLVLKPSHLTKCCDDVLMLRYLIDQHAQRQGIQISQNDLWLPSQWTLERDGESIFVGNAYRGLSNAGLYAMGGILNHADTIAAVALANRTRDLAYSPLRLCASQHPLSICCVRVGSNNPSDRTIEFRGALADCNPYLVFSAVLMAMIDGIQNKMLPGPALEVPKEGLISSDAFSIGSENGRPTSRPFLMSKLMSDCDFLSRGEVFSDALIELLCQQLGNSTE